MSDPGDPSGQTIEVYCRIRPAKRLSKIYTINSETSQSVLFTVPHDQSAGFVNNQRETFRFPFQYVFDQDSKQDQIFDRIAAKVIDNVIDGYNGTMFAYGQTGSGKTFTITGGAEHYSDRGLIPRSISYLFDYIDKHRHEATFSVLVSYLEIYNNCGYDLLSPEHDNKKLEDLPKITWVDEDCNDEGEERLSRLKRYPAATTEDALNLLFVGDTNRVICETPMNDASSRSHCIFMMALESRSKTSDMIRRSRLNLVDLAGSERVAKTQVSGRILTEARAINLSLHYLEQCIVALHEKAQGKRVHIPYRNSMITWVLKDSLGGNCKTVMIANISVDQLNIIESISTCRFAQRVAMIVNQATINEHIDPALVIERLKRRIQELQVQLAERCNCQTEGQPTAEVLTVETKSQVESQIGTFLQSGEDQDGNALALMSRLKVTYAFVYLRHLFHTRPERGPSKIDEGAVQNLKAMVESRDGEIAILVNMLKARGIPERPVVNASRVETALAATGAKLLSDQADDILERDRSLELFRQGHALNTKIQNGIEQLRVKFTEAKSQGEKVATLMKEIDRTKSMLQQRRITQAVKQISNGEDGTAIDNREIEVLCDKMNSDKTVYAEAVASLKKLKLEIEHTQRFLSNSRARLQSEFERQWEERKRTQQVAVFDTNHKIAARIIDRDVDADINAFYEMSRQVKKSMI